MWTEYSAVSKKECAEKITRLTARLNFRMLSSLSICFNELKERVSFEINDLIEIIYLKYFDLYLNENDLKLIQIHRKYSKHFDQNVDY